MGDTGLIDRDGPSVLHLPKGSMRVETHPGLLRATVGGEIAIAVTSPGRGGGGLLHLSDHVAALTEPAGALPERWSRALTQLLNTFAALSRPSDRITATFVGAGDLLGLLTRGRHAEIAQAWTTVLAGWFAERGVASAAEVGGNRARLVTVDTGAGTVEVEPLGFGRQRTAAAGSAPPPSEPEQPRDTVVGIGALHVDRSPHRLVTILGSCVGIALFDPSSRIGGLAHAMMPRNPGEGGEPGRFVDTAVEALAAAVVRAGAARRGLLAKIAGGASVLLADSGAAARFRVASQNVAAAREALQVARIPLIAEHVGGVRGCRMQVDLRDFRISVRPLSEARQ